MSKTKVKFLLQNLLRGIIALALIVLGLILINDNLDDQRLEWVFNLHPLMVYIVFLASEVVFGIIPPEFFMVWSVKGGLFESYALDILLLSIISFLAGILGYNIGSAFSTSGWFLKLKAKFLEKYEKQLMNYGGFLIFVAAMTPLPFSAICMLVGAYSYPFYQFLMFASFRFVRYALYAFIIWQSLKV